MPPPPRSPTVPLPGQSEADVLDARALAWRSRPLLRQIYHRYFTEMVQHLARPHPDSLHPHGRVIELGGGSGNFREFFPNVIATDIVPTPHVHLAVDALRLPFADASIDNLLLQDVLHHLPYPLQFFHEAQRVLRPGGRLVMTEPYISLASRLVFKLAHPEPVIMSAQIFPQSPAHPDPLAFTGQGPFASNQAIPTLLFFRDLPRFTARFPRLTLKKRALRSTLVYPLSGGFSGPKLIPTPLLPLAWPLDSLLTPLGKLLAFRLLIVLEKT